MARSNQQLVEGKKSELCSLYALYDIFHLNGIDISAAELMLMNIDSLFNTIEFNCQSLSLQSITILDFKSELKCFDELKLNYKKINDKELEIAIQDGKPVLAYMYREMNVREKPYYIGHTHSVILTKKDGKVILSDPHGTTYLSDEDISLVERARTANLYPYPPNKAAYVLENNEQSKITKSQIDILIKKQISEMYKNYSVSVSKDDGNGITINYGKNAYLSMLNRLETIGELDDSPFSKRMFTIQLYIYLKGFIDSPTFFRSEISNALREYGEKNDIDCFLKSAEFLDDSAKVLIKMNELLKESKNYINDKSRLTNKLSDFVKELYDIDCNIVNILSEYRKN